MQIKCPNCNTAVEQHRPPAKNDPGAGDAWVCFKCPAVICAWCYMNHIGTEHPEAYRVGVSKKPTVGGKKGKKTKKR